MDRLLLRGLRWCVALTVAGVVLAAVALVAQGPAVPAKRLAFAFKFGAVCLTTWEVTRSRRARRHARVLAVGYTSVVIWLVAVTLHAIAAARWMAAPAFVAVMTGTALLLPWGLATQAVVCAASLAGWAWVATAAPQFAEPSAVAVLLAAAVAALGAARMTDGQCAGSSRRRWQRRELVALARDLAGASEREQVIDAAFARGRRLLAADSVSFSSYDAACRLFRVERLTTGDGDGDEMHWMQGLEVPEDFPLVPQILARGVWALPADDPTTSIRPVLDQHGVRHVLYAALRCGGELVGMLGFVRRTDVPFGRTERELVRGVADQTALALRTAGLVADLRLANRLKSDFVARMSHELRTPLTVILGFAEMARDADLSADERGEFLDRIERAGRDLLALIETTLEIRQMEAGREDVQLEPVRLLPFWTGIGDACERLPHAETVRLEWDSEVPDIALVTDRRKLSMIVRNLVDNALKFTERGHVRAGLRLEGEHVVLRVSDTGIGIRPEDQAVVFELFRQADGSASRRYEGTGLGLYVVQRFVQQLGGTVALQSTPGAGSVFTVTLPRATDASPLERAA